MRVGWENELYYVFFVLFFPLVGFALMTDDR